ncbi:glycosyl transferase family 1 [Methanosarcina sp. 1.H.T.1A.1]|uniref:glycosyltransferase n=1 Tax=Methanosarcina sp. 1.H.T.1A.1 TaxID=1483602 RepID=UPI00062160F8|nr:glycosyltransferase [Methanosarcina sp. 1.H.T.1A.1]KKH96469.1 glycosyl transferase family 1 [Methanosarcina sp. 1.H.T.1A.1]
MDPTEFKNFHHKKLLVITSLYPNSSGEYIGGSFVKNQIDSLSQYFKEIFVISPVLFSFKVLSNDKLCQDYTYDNVKVFYPRCTYIPIFYFNKILIDNRFKVVRNLIEKEGISFDIIHSHFTWPSAYIGSKLKETYKIPLFVTIHENSKWFCDEVNMDYSLINNSWKSADALIRVNKKDIPVLKKFNENSFFIPNGYPSKFKPLSKTECRRQLNLPSNAVILFSLGWLVERKGFGYLIKSMKILKEKRRKEVLCFIGGSGPLKNKLQKQIDSSKLQNEVKLLGSVPDNLLPLWMNACDFFVLPSLSESFGVVQVEAMACGTPVISTYNGGSEEIIISEDYGLLAKPKNSEDLAEKISYAIDHKWDKSKILDYMEQFRWDNIVINLLTVYKDV